MKTDIELELAVRKGMIPFLRSFFGLNPKEIRVRAFDDMLVLRMMGMMTRAQQQQVGSTPGGSGRDFFKSIRTQLVETAREEMCGMIAQVAGVPVLSLHHDVSTRTGEEVLLFRLSCAAGITS